MHYKHRQSYGCLIVFYKSIAFVNLILIAKNKEDRV